MCSKFPMVLRRNAPKLENKSTMDFHIVAASFSGFSFAEMGWKTRRSANVTSSRQVLTKPLSKEREPCMQVRFISGSIAHLNWLSNGSDCGVIGVTSAPTALQPATQLYRPFSRNAPPVQGRY